MTCPSDGERDYSVVCGATNHSAGDVIALATVGTVLPGNFKIKRSKIRGVPSEGMICSEKELGLPDTIDGVLILPPDTPLGKPLTEVLDAGDVILEVSPTANRGDCLSVVGVARELAAISGWSLKGAAAEPPGRHGDRVDTATAGVGSWGLEVNIRVDDSDGCHRYCGAVLKGVTVGPSPSWMSSRLEACGVRSINNVVDCTNYAMMELGNPLHAFDWQGIRGQYIGVRRAEPGERLTTLDGAERALVPEDLLIVDAEGPTALAGVMGGQDSEVRDDSTTLFLESAHFDPASVRRTAHRLKISSEASYRFARGVDPELPRRALERLMALLIETAGGELVGEVADVNPVAAPKAPVTLRIARIKGLLGFEMDAEEARGLLVRGGLNPAETATSDALGEHIVVHPPSWRFDIEREVDVLEEIARMAGYDRIPEAEPSGVLQPTSRQPAGVNQLGLRERMAEEGLSEALHFSFIDPSWLVELGLHEDHPWRARAVAIENPLSEVGGILRPTLLPSLLHAVARNRAVGNPDVRLFELRTCFLTRPGGVEAILAGADGRPLDKTPMLETRKLAGVLVGRRSPPGWNASTDDDVDFYDAMACVSAARDVIQWHDGMRWSTGGPAEALTFLDPRERAALTRGRDTVGWVGRIAIGALKAYKIDAPVYAFELDVGALTPRKAPRTQYSKISEYPAAERDLALVVPDSLSADEVISLAGKTATKGLKDAFKGVDVFDVYRGEGIPEGARSLALRFRFRALDRTLKDKEIDAVMGKVEKALAARHQLTVRR